MLPTSLQSALPRRATAGASRATPAPARRASHVMT